MNDNCERFREIINIQKGNIVWKDYDIPNWAKVIL